MDYIGKTNPIPNPNPNPNTNPNQAPAWPVDYIGQIDDWEALAKGSWNELLVTRVDECDEVA